MGGIGNVAVYRHILVLPPPPKSLPSKNENPPTAILWCYRLRRSRYRQKNTAICDTAYKSAVMSEWSEGMAVRPLVGIR